MCKTRKEIERCIADATRWCRAADCDALKFLYGMWAQTAKDQLPVHTRKCQECMDEGVSA
jgi:hypothetical protein